ncbi:ground-like domain protein [Dictyocaulus viviparus]|uniref:Ground-like domain protein n=1 Tax=Dictyocaulus viviparus TaxID=29172 RepID=A0A0D8XMG2_DICVI|nr:ground-like domain protein [Dictyocaulus viviparus]
MCHCARPTYIPMMYPAYAYRPYAIQAYSIPASTNGAIGGCGNREMEYYKLPAKNDCCGGCSSPCMYKRHAAAFSSITVNPSCNNDSLRSIIEEFITTDSSESKRAIQEAAEEQLEVNINVICGRGEFSYVTHTENFCQVSSDNITCYAFQPH